MEAGGFDMDGTAFLSVEQNATLASAYADSAYAFKIGAMLLEDTSKNLLRNDEIKTSFLGESGQKDNIPIQAVERSRLLQGGRYGERHPISS